MRYINTTNNNITFTDVDGRVVIVPKNRVYTHFKNDTITFLLVERYDKEGICLFTTLAEDLQINGVTYTYEQLLNGEGTGDMFSPTGLIIKLVDELPESGKQSTIYLIANDKGSFTEYLWLEETSKWEELGDVSKIDLSNYFTKSEINAMFANYYTQSEIDDMFDGYYAKDELYSKTESDTKYATQTVVNEEIAARIQGDSAINTALQSKADKSDTYTKTQVDTAMASKANTADLATVATSGSYDDLSNKPTIPTVPTNVSAFTNDAGYLTEHQSLDDYYTKSEVNTELADKQDKLTAGTNITIDANNVISSTGGEQQQADWNQTDDTAVDYIKNKPVIPDTSEFVTKEEYNPKEVAIAEALTDLNENKADKTEIPVVPDMTNYYTKSEIDAMIGNINTILASI